MTVVLALESISIRFGGVQALQRASVAVNQGEFVGLIGPNGAGKTTLLRIVAGILRADSGRVILRGADMTGDATATRVRKGLALTHQIVRPFRSMTVLENLMVGLDFAAHRELLETEARRREAAMSILKRIGLAGRANVPTAALTQVDLRKMELARALATGPKLLISDEAMAGLSTSEVDEVLDLLISLCGEDIAIIMIEHIMQAVMRFSERVMCLDAGRIIAIGAPAEVMANARVQEAYLGT